MWKCFKIGLKIFILKGLRICISKQCIVKILNFLLKNSK